MSEDSIIHRRQALKALGVSAAGLVAGCLGGDGDGGDGGDGSDGSTDGGDGSDGSTDSGDGGDGGDGGTSQPDFPSDDVRLVVPWSPGGGIDFHARATRPYWEEYLPGDGYEVAVENIEGGSGTRGTMDVWNAEPTGHDMVMSTNGGVVTQQFVRDTEYDMRDMTHVGVLSLDPPSIEVRQDLELNGWNDFVDQVEDLNFATQGQGSTAHIQPILLGQMSGAWDPDDLNFVHLDWGETISAFERGDVDALMSDVATTKGHIDQIPDTLEMLVSFTEEENTLPAYQELAQSYYTDYDIENVEQFNTAGALIRWWTATPDVPEENRQVLEDAHLEMMEDDQLHEDLSEFPVQNWGPGEDALEVLDAQLEAYSQEPLASTLRNSLG